MGFLQKFVQSNPATVVAMEFLDIALHRLLLFRGHVDKSNENTHQTQVQVVVALISAFVSVASGLVESARSYVS